MIFSVEEQLQLELNEKNKKLEQSKAAYDVQLDHIDKLRNLNIYNQIFNISAIVKTKINAALGQIVLLLVFLIKRLNLKLTSYKLVPLGSQSQIIKFNSHENDDGSGKSKTVLNLYSSDEFSLGKLFNFNKLDVALIALLDIVSIIEHKLLTIDPEIVLPYKIQKDTIGGKSIRVTSNSDWTSSCKFLLTNLNWILTFVSVHTSVDDNE
ncbi:Autophagy-related protein 6 [Candida viswanathii]|uniref:Autophagy-related protein 6 n=1 Tax=Candida viswanathii TaxID=5486 RepID=A0A367Y038_9ASCO|nr:Autophagy-related protein 6 [Candida viswanathii]